MTAVLRRNAGISRLLQSHSVAHLVDPTRARAPVTRTSALRSRAYFRFPEFIRKTREYEFFPSFFSYPFSSSSSSSSASKTGFVSWYLGMVKSRPVLTKSITSALIYTAADLTSQTIALPSTEAFDFLRTLRMAGYGMLILGPSLHFWFNFMSKLFPKRDLCSTLKKMAMGQALYGPAMTVTFFSMNACLQGENMTEIFARLKRDLLPTMLNGVMYWPVCDFITFRFTPVHLQVCALFFLTLACRSVSQGKVQGFQTTHLTQKIWLLTCESGTCGLILAAIGEQFVFIFVDHLHDLHGKPRESKLNY